MFPRPNFLKPLLLLWVLAAAACNAASLQPPPVKPVTQPRTGLVSPVPTRQPSPTLAPTQTLPPAFTPTPEPTVPPPPAPPPPPLPTPILATTLAAEHIIDDIRGHRSLLALDCETAAALDWARMFGKNFDERTFQRQLPVSDNPDYGFVGDVNAAWGLIPPAGYGVYAGPVAELLHAHGIQAKAYKGYTLDQIKAKIDQDIPVMTWVVGNVDKGTPRSYTDSEGRLTVVAPYEHVVIVYGYSPTIINFMSEGKLYRATIEQFLSSWGVLGNMVIVDN